MTANQTKSKIQAEALAEVKKNNGWGTVAIATGGGKSKIAIDWCKELVSLKADAKILIIVPTEKLRDENWKEEFDKWNAKRIWAKNVDRTCYVSANKISGMKYNLVVMDEGHNITLANSLFFDQNEVENCLCLTATPPENSEKKEILKHLGIKVVYELPLDKGVELGIVSPYKITIIETLLDDKDKYITAGTKIAPFKTTEKKQYDYLTKKVTQAMYSTRRDASKWSRLNRMRFIYNLKSKTIAAKYLLENYIPQDERTLIFCGGIKQAEELSPTFYHSKSDSIDFDAFKREEINRLSCVKSLNEGHNIPKVDNALVVQLTSKELDLVQRIGRIVRYRKGHIGQIYLVVCVDTVDVNWMDKALKGFDKSNVNHIRFENILNNNNLLI